MTTVHLVRRQCGDCAETSLLGCYSTPEAARRFVEHNGVRDARIDPVGLDDMDACGISQRSVNAGATLMLVRNPLDMDRVLAELEELAAVDGGITLAAALIRTPTLTKVLASHACWCEEDETGARAKALLERLSACSGEFGRFWPGA